ncbi:MAG: hypothetical protein ABI024_01425 [Vicinamibacterales bacterium]
MIPRILCVLAVAGVLFPLPVSAQPFEASAHVAGSQWSEFDGTDLGFGGRLTWKPSSLIGVDADVTWYPSDFPDRIAFTRSRLEGVFGVTVGPRLNRVSPFAKAAAGFLRVGESPGAFACIAIFPPPLSCALAGGDTLPAYEIGGGLGIDATARTFIRADVTDRILKYPGPTFDDDFEIREEGFFGHALRFTIGAGFRF